MNINNHLKSFCSGILSLSVIGLCSCSSGPGSVALESAYSDQGLQQKRQMNQVAEPQQFKPLVAEHPQTVSQLDQITSGGDSHLSVSQDETEQYPSESNISNIELPIPDSDSEEVNSQIEQVSSEMVLVTSPEKQVIRNLDTYLSQTVFKTVTTASEPRKPLLNNNSSEDEKITLALNSNWDDFRDENLLDGGDRAHPIHLDRYGYAGLDTEDTFVEYDDHTGKNHLKPTNNVMIYSPRFGAVRAIHKPLAGVEIAKVGANDQTERTTGMKKRIATSHHGQRIGTDRIRVRSRISGLDTDSLLSGLSERTVITEHNRILNTYIDEVTTYFGGFNQQDKAEITAKIQAAMAWTRDDNPIISASTAGAMDMETVTVASEYVGIKDKKTKGRLKIIKMADKKTAIKGDIVKFTIHFSNLGDRELTNIKVVDNLTPRLEYISESATSDLEGKLDVYENGEGSLILTFKISEQLKGHQSSKVTFDCRVK